MLPKPASTVIIVAHWSNVLKSRISPPTSNYRIFMVKRSSKSRFMASHYVFPGGIEEPQDRKSDAWREIFGNEIDNLSDEEFAHRITAIRETFEESGIQLFSKLLDSQLDEDELQDWRKKVHSDASQFLAFCKRFSVIPAINVLIPWSHWITPKQERWRYDTRFYLTSLNSLSQSILHCGLETVTSKWLAPEEALDLFEKQEIMLPPTTWYTLYEMTKFKTIEELLEQSGKRQIIPVEPELKIKDEQVIVALPGDPLLLKGKNATNYHRIEIYGKNKFVLNNAKIETKPSNFTKAKL